MKIASRHPAETFPPGEYLDDELRARRWSADEFATRSGLSLGDVLGVLAGERRISARIADGIGHGFGTSAVYWANLQRARERRTG